MGLTVARAELARLHAHAREGYPHEVVGLLAGAGGRVVKVVPLVNERADTPANRYLVGPLALSRAERAVEAEGLEVVGYYHSHPDHDARYSDYDRDHAVSPGVVYLITSVVGGHVADTRVWRLREARDAMDELPLDTED